MAIDVQERSRGFILYPKHVNEYPQPVPFGTLPAAAGQLPAWEQKKLELEMANANVNGDDESDEAEQEQPLPQEIQTQPHQQKQQQQLPKQSSLRRTGSALFSSLRSPPSRSHNANGNSNGNGTKGRTGSPSSAMINNQYPADGQRPPLVDGNGSTVHIHHDASGGIVTSPRASSKKRSSAFMLYLKKHFGVENHPEYTPRQRSMQNSASPVQNSSNSSSGGSNKIKKSPSQRLAATSSSNGILNRNRDSELNRKTRSSGFANKMRLASGKMSSRMKQTWRRFNSKSNPEELPATWEEWRKAYARGQMDINDLPPPPQAQSRGDTTSDEYDNPYEKKLLLGPMPEDHRRRQLAFNRLDFEGKRGGIKPSEIAVPAGEEQLPDTLEGHPAFRDIVSKARETFDSSIAILTVFNENRQLFLAETGLGGMKEVPREVSFCSHAVLQQPPGPFILNDTQKDWRFANSPLVQQHGCRAYYGVPLLAPDFSGSDDDPVPIGTLCIIDNKPRENFSLEQRQKMNDLALLAQKTIANWSRARFRARLDAMERSFQLWKNEAASLADGPGTNMGLYQSARENMILQQQQQEQQRQKAIGYAQNGSAGRQSANTDNNRDHIAPMNGNTHPEQPDLYISKVPEARSRGSEETIENGNAVPQLPATNKPEGKSRDPDHTASVTSNNKQKIYDISTRLVGESLELTLVYILRLNLAPHQRTSVDSNNNGSQPSSQGDATDSVQSLALVSSFGLPSPEPAFDAVLHMKALRSEEGGLLYQNPRADELRSGERLPHGEEVEYASALLVPVCESETSGYVLAGFTDDPERVFERSDLEYMTTIASELSTYLMD